MNNAFWFTRSRWSVRVSAVAGLVLLPACSMPAAFQPEPDHVFSARSPQQLEHASGSLEIPVRARYPRTVSTEKPDQMTSTDEVSSSSDTEQSIRQAAWSSENRKNPFQFASYQPHTQTGDEEAAGIVRTSFVAAEPRQYTDPSCPPSNQMQTVAAGPLADLFPDEYVFDGGDRNAPMHYTAGDRVGLDTEDTLAEFVDHTGTYRVKPSNRVAVYSPRFGSVRTVTGLETDIKIDKALGARDAISAGNLNSELSGEENTRTVGIVGLDSRRRADGMETSLPPSQASRTDQIVMSSKVDKGLEDRKYTSVNELGKLDSPVISEQLRNAVVWTRNQFPQITVNTSGAGEVKAFFKPQLTIGIEDERQTKGDLRIVKLADRSTAQAGDIVTFTIRVQNVGDFDVYDVRIVDNLTPRLLYVEGSAGIDEQNPGEVTAVPNGEGSQILTFTLDQPLKGHSSAVITFETRVR